MKNIFFLALGLAFSVMTKAETGAVDDVVIIKETPNAVYEGSSEYHRMKKQYQISLMPMGLGPNPILATGLNFGFYLNRNSLFLLTITNSNKGFSCSGDLSCESSGQSFGIYYKRFVSNSFYYSLGIDRRRVSYSEETSNSSPFDYKYSFEGTSTAAGFTIGNQWQWENFTLGCDWIGLSVPLEHLIKNENMSGAPEFGQSSLTRNEDYFIKNTANQSLRFYLGASF
jgi:hypothetical protein